MVALRYEKGLVYFLKGTPLSQKSPRPPISMPIRKRRILVLLALQTSSIFPTVGQETQRKERENNSTVSHCQGGQRSKSPRS